MEPFQITTVFDNYWCTDKKLRMFIRILWNSSKSHDDN